MKQLRITIILLLTLATILFVSCEEQQATRQPIATDSLINNAYQLRDYDSIISLKSRQLV